MVFQSNSDIQTKQFAETLAEKFKAGGVIALMGDLGAGKTTFTQGFAKALGINEKVISPTFILLKQYKIASGNILYHLDLYRLENTSDIDSLGLSEIFEDKTNIVLIEWAEKILDKLPKEAVKIRIKKLGENIREFEVS